MGNLVLERFCQVLHCC
uniref:Uncharacterized protein n=1 Tax=Anguilla anguilla TaxID=7936 RepID=A0A0E9UJH0_ANGAN